jgi:hypothetical protein
MRVNWLSGRVRVTAFVGLLKGFSRASQGLLKLLRASSSGFSSRGCCVASVSRKQDASRGLVVLVVLVVPVVLLPARASSSSSSSSIRLLRFHSPSRALLAIKPASQHSGPLSPTLPCQLLFPRPSQLQTRSLTLNLNLLPRTTHSSGLRRTLPPPPLSSFVPLLSYSSSSRLGLLSRPTTTSYATAHQRSRSTLALGALALSQHLRPQQPLRKGPGCHRVGLDCHRYEISTKNHLLPPAPPAHPVLSIQAAPQRPWATSTVPSLPMSVLLS